MRRQDNAPVAGRGAISENQYPAGISAFLSLVQPGGWST